MPSETDRQVLLTGNSGNSSSSSSSSSENSPLPSPRLGPRRRDSCATVVSSEDSDMAEDFQLTEEQSFTWLQYERGPQKNADSAWAMTFVARRKMLETTSGDKQISTDDYVKKFKILDTKDGYKFFQSDFGRLFPGKSEIFYLKFPIVREKVIAALVLSLENKGPDGDLQEILDLYNKGGESADIAAIRGIPYLFDTIPPIGLGRRGCQRVKTSDFRSNFLAKVISPDELERFHASRQSFLHLKKFPAQPCIVAVGEDWSSISQFVVWVSDKLSYTFSRATRALDITYQIYWALHLQYSCDVAACWEFIERIVYETCSKPCSSQAMEGVVAMFKGDESDDTVNPVIGIEQIGTYIAPEPFVLGRRTDFIFKGAKRILIQPNCEAHIIPLRKVLAQFFKLNNVLKDTLTYIDKLNQLDPKIATHAFWHGSLWQSKMAKHEGKLVFPIFLYFDDYEPLNALGSHSGIHKLGAIYTQVACLPNHLKSQLQCIFLTMLFHSSDRVQFGNRVLFQPLVNEFNFLKKHGVYVSTPDYEGIIYFELALILGDNLGVHAITGFTESFYTLSSCRVCKVLKPQREVQFLEDKSLLRNKHNYDTDLVANCVSLTGIKEKCIWLDVDGFDMFQQIGVDCMHDILEGVAKYVMAELIVTLIDKLKLITINELNDKIHSFDLGPARKDRPVTISLDNMRSKTMRQTASEMNVFCRNFGVMYGSYVDRGNQYWAIYLQLMMIMDIVMATHPIHYSTPDILQFLIYELCDMYTSLFSTHLPPKFHNLLHYPAFIKRFSGLRHCSSIRFEAKHKPLELTAKSSSNRRNMTLTAAKRHQLAQNLLFINGKLMSHIVISKKQCPISAEVQCALTVNFPNIRTFQHMKIVDWIKVGSEHYMTKTVLLHRFETELPTFCRIKSILFDCDNQKIYFSVSSLKSLNFDFHYRAYTVCQDSDNNDVDYLDYDELFSPFPCNIIPIPSKHTSARLYHVVLLEPIN